MDKVAEKFAREAHANQLRKYTNEPYIDHPAAVVELVRSVSHTNEMICAAWLHDVVEDTEVTLDEIRDVFGSVVADYVRQLTDVSKPSDGNRLLRKELDRIHLSLACPKVQTVKLADIIDNTSSIVRYDPKFAKVYLEEKAQLLEALQKGDPAFVALALTIKESI
jgi:(p)ppGpp synthase/HD superfamily hydrolase